MSDFTWCDIDLVLPNPKNPRKDPGVKSEEIQKIIKSKGWEEGITVYKKGIFYVILSGHRRWYSAKKMGIREIPLYIVKAPDSDIEELERLGSVQSGQIDWTPYEWASYTYNIWKSLGEISYSELARRFNVSHNLIGARIRVIQYYPRVEVETKLENGMYSISMLDYVRGWIERLKEYHPILVDAMSEDIIRQTMLRKLEHRCFGSELSNDQFVIKATDKDILRFLTDTNKKLVDASKELEAKIDIVKITNVKHNTRKIKLTTKVIEKVNYRTKNEAEQILKSLEELEREIDEKQRALFSKMKEEPSLFYQ